MSTTASIQYLLVTPTAARSMRDDAAKARVHADAAKAREILFRPEPLLYLSLHVDGTLVCVFSAPYRAISLPSENTRLSSSPGESFIKGLGHCKDHTEASLRLGASVIDRTNCFDNVVERFQQLTAAVDEFNQANLTVASCSDDYSAFESYYINRSPSIPKAMSRIRDAMLAQLTTSSSSTPA